MSRASVRARLVVVAMSALCLSTLSACGAGGQTVTARFTSVAPLVNGNQVKIDGIVVGKIESMRVRNGQAEVTMKLDREAFPLHSDATFTIRPASLLGERYVALDRGTPSAPSLDTSRVVPVSQTGSNVGMDEVLNTMDDPASEGLAMLITTLGSGVSGNGENVDQTITKLAPDMKEIRALAAVLSNHNELLGSLVQNAQPIVGALADHDGQTLDRLVSSSDRLLGATAAQQADLEKTVGALPGTLRSGRKTLKDLSTTANEAAPTLDALHPVTEDLPQISKELNKFSDALDPALASSEPVLDRAEELLREAQRPADDLRIGSPALATTVRGTRTIVHGLTRNREAMFTFIKRWALNTNGYDGLSHYWRVNLTLNSDSWTALLSLLGGGVPAAAGANSGAKSSAPVASADASDSDGSAPQLPIDVPGVVGGVTKQLPGLTKGITDAPRSLLNGKGTADGGHTGLSKKQEGGLLGFLFGGGE